MRYEKEQLLFNELIWYYSGALLFHTIKLAPFSFTFSRFDRACGAFAASFVNLFVLVAVFDYLFDKLTMGRA